MLEALKGDAFVLVARRDGLAIRYLFATVEGPDPVWYTGDTHAELAHLCVTGGERGSGVGGALVDAVDAQPDRLGVADVLLDYLAGNDAAARFYERRGFVPFVNALYRRRETAAAAPPPPPDDSGTQEDP